MEMAAARIGGRRKTAGDTQHQHHEFTTTHRLSEVDWLTSPSATLNCTGKLRTALSGDY